ncbi:uncharacterized protein HMPREF1541_00370 [Cyphellophora europaea CBS 101466]|uniref:Uncharacterized protein n=1 Tax=Cyphellophora europaea (strain CBS 101466) TaxID=1220924 RepID=W2SBS3_CYPE1|nr:uncharacterized protein HMPREF1541_00370 [Cyphellophora europaea CBS 101466]ETN46186.1 hypothetical protein HMPREF1541_00370 [Cyphellophora europaea CBS 101466]
MEDAALDRAILAQPRANISQPRGSNSSNCVIDMLATKIYTNPAAKVLREVNTQYMAPSDPFLAVHDDSAAPVLAEQRPVLKRASLPRASYTASEGRGSHHTTPESRSGYGSQEDYHGASDISVRKSMSSVTDAELFSDIDDDSDSIEEEDDEPSGFEPTEVAELGPMTSGALGPNEVAVDFSSEGLNKHASYGGEVDTDSDDDQDHAHPNEQQSRARTFSYESHLYEATSPTESQLVDEGFEFHNQLPEDSQLGKFANDAFREALKDVSPDLPRKQQWYAWRKVVEMLEQHERGHDDEDDFFDDSDLPNDFSLGSLADRSFGGCHCGGDKSRCTCGPGSCYCSGCRPQSQRSEANAHAQRTIEEDQQDVPMNIDYAPITPSFPPNIHHARPSHISQMTQVGIAKDHVPDPYYDTEESAGPHPISISRMATNGTASNPGCGCKCGSKCACPTGACRCAQRDKDVHAATSATITSKELFEIPVKRSAAIFDPQENWSDAATAGRSPPPSDIKEPQVFQENFPQIATALSTPSILSPQDAPTPAPPLCSPMRSPMRSPERLAHTPATTISRPDTPRPVGDTYEHGIRQSVEPEPLSPVSHRHSTPAYENRSRSPSPISPATPSDTEMRDLTPTQPWQPYEREASVLPDAPDIEALSPPDSPDADVPPMPAFPAHYSSRMATVPHMQHPPPPIPMSPTLKPRKQRATSTSIPSSKRNTKSGVQGAKVVKPQPKSRNVTRKVTSKVVKGKRDVTGAKVRQAVERIEDSVRNELEIDGGVLQKDGTPPRRSTRVRARSGSPDI